MEQHIQHFKYEKNKNKCFTTIVNYAILCCKTSRKEQKLGQTETRVCNLSVWLKSIAQFRVQSDYSFFNNSDRNSRDRVNIANTANQHHWIIPMTKLSNSIKSQ
ncbi:hypothetical protein GDO78_007410 [Eleutherodactylus coqui]|uniref:Uncharacterized protein n=1 Tax=Eleutherodactylus coqui TaxID=57060 RepID=A0A8J6FIW6_ELECQ|nr:hypothetical protein GDO78_007410 [Eleutherodactylus coqui]